MQDNLGNERLKEKILELSHSMTSREPSKADPAGYFQGNPEEEVFVDDEYYDDYV